MATKITFFPVENGDITLINLGDESESTLLIDCNIRQAADDEEDGMRDVASDLRKRIRKDGKGRPYVDAFLLSHPDEDHCWGLARHFYLGPLKDYPDDSKVADEKRIVIREIWSSPMVFRRACKNHPLCDDVVDFNTEAKRRVKINRDKNFSVGGGDRILVLGEDEDGKTDDLGPILVKPDEYITQINGSEVSRFAAQLLAPLPSADEEMEEELTKNNSSVILNIELTVEESSEAPLRFLTGGDAEVTVWEMLWERHEENPSALQYNLLQTPHHCSWHSLSHDSWSDLHEDAELSQDAYSALSQIHSGGKIVASSCPIKDDDNDPPCWGAKLVYEGIAKDAGGKFFCTGEYPNTQAVAPLEFEVTSSEFQLPSAKESKAINSLLRPAAVSAGLAFPNKPVKPNKPAGFAQ